MKKMLSILKEAFASLLKEFARHMWAILSPFYKTKTCRCVAALVAGYTACYYMYAGAELGVILFQVFLHLCIANTVFALHYIDNIIVECCE